MNDILSLAAEYRTLLSIVVCTLSIIILLHNYWESVSVWLKSIFYRMAVIGRNSRLSKRLELDGQGWFNTEREVCNAFIRDYEKFNADEEHYQQASQYLDKVGDKGITPLKWFHWFGISLLVIVEASGFAYVLAGFTLQDASESLQKEAAIAIAFLISALLVLLTHTMGGELYRNQQIDKVRLRWNNSTNKSAIIEPDNMVSLKSKRNHIDDEQPGWQQMANRLNKVNANFSKTWSMTIITLVFMGIVAVGATYVRGQVLEKLAIEQVQGEKASKNDAFTFNDPFAAPQEAKQVNNASDNIAEEEKMSAHKKAGWTTFIILAVIFLAMQCYSIYLGFKTTFSGKESKEAYRYVYKFENVTDYIRYYSKKRESVGRVAQSVLSHLQSKISRYAQQNSGERAVLQAAAHPTSRNFINFLKLEVLRHNQPVELRAEEPTEQPTVSEVIQGVSANEPMAPEKTTESNHQDNIVARVKAGDIDGLSDEQVLQAMKQLKEQKKETPQERLARLQALV